MAIAYDATGAGSTTFTNFSTSLSTSWSHTATGPVVVAINSFTSTIQIASLTRTVTYGAQPMTSLIAYQYAGDYFIEFFGLLNPPAGAQTVQATVSGGANTGRVLTGNSVSYTGVNSFGASATNNGSGASMSLSISSAAGQMVAQAFASRGTISGYSQTQRWNIASTDGFGRRFLGGDAPGAGTVNFTGNQSGGESWGGVAIQLVPATPTNLFFPMFQ